MPAVYPTNKVNFTRKVDLQDLVVAADINSAYDEIEAIQATLGLLPALQGSTNWGTVKARLENIESVLGTAITPSSSSVTSGFGYKRITASTSAPSSGDGANGDVWLQYV
jgi:hypothetical protein